MTVLLLLALALAADAFAVALVQGASARLGPAGALRIALAFGVAQGVMPGIGFALGSLFTGFVAATGHWIAFVLLAVLGTRMIREGVRPDGGVAAKALSGSALLSAALATSIDAAAAGITLPLLGVPPLLACVTIGVVTAALCFLATLFGARLGTRFGGRAEIGGGLVLIALGIKVLIDHGVL